MRGCGRPGERIRWRWWAPRCPGDRWAYSWAGGPQHGGGRCSLTRLFFFVWQKRRGVDRGPATLRAAGLVERLAGLGEAPPRGGGGLERPFAPRSAAPGPGEAARGAACRRSSIPNSRSRSAKLAGCPEQRARCRSPPAIPAPGDRIRSALGCERVLLPKAGEASGRVGSVPCTQSKDALDRAPRFFFLSLSIFVARNSACSHNGRILSSNETRNFLEKRSGLHLSEGLACLSFSFLHLLFLKAENSLITVTQHSKRDVRDRNL